MKFGIFDYIDRRDEPLAKTFDDRMALLGAAEDAGFYGYHLTEHHATPLSATPSPTVYLAAAARETTRIRLGALLFLLPLYNPVRLAEELAMLDNLCRGRLDVGVGRGISPAEFAALGIDFEQSEEMFGEAFEVVHKAFTQDRVDHHGKHFRCDDVPVVIHPMQRPFPPLGTFLEGFAMLVLTLPIVFPVIVDLGFDPIWFGVVMVIVLEMGLISPPVGVNVFVVKGIAEDVPMRQIFAGILPFWAAMLVCLVILVMFPEIALFLPNTMIQ